MIHGEAALLLAADSGQRFSDAFYPVAGSATSNDKIPIFTFSKLDVESFHPTYRVSANENRRNDGPMSVGQSLRERHGSLSETLEEFFVPVAEKEPRRRVDDRAFWMLVHVPALHF